MTIHERPFGRYLEDFVPGDIYPHWPGKTITEADDHLFCMITMNHHPLHTNQWFAENETVHGKNVVVGNLVSSLVLGMSVPDVSGAAIANLEIDTLKHAKPTFHGDTIYAETRVLEVKESRSKPDRGIVTVETKGINQRGEEVCYFKRKVLIWKKEADPLIWSAISPSRGRRVGVRTRAVPRSVYSRGGSPHCARRVRAGRVPLRPGRSRGRR
jgi:acyl dehydratase